MFKNYYIQQINYQINIKTTRSGRKRPAVATLLEKACFYTTADSVCDSANFIRLTDY
jgi:hypothetical protein